MITNNTQVLVGGQAVVTQSDIFNISGCSFTVPPAKPQPCVTVKWLLASKRILINGQSVILQDSTALCQSSEQIPQGAPIVITTQMKARGV